MSRITNFLAAALLVLATLPASAAAEQKTTTTAPVTQTAAATDESHGDSRDVRRDLMQVLDQYPPSVGTVLKLDPSLFGDPNYMANYPALADFVSKNPVVAHNPAFYLESVPGIGYRDPNPPGVRVFMEILGGATGFAVFLTVTYVLTWLIRTMIQQRRWSRLAAIQTEVHSKLLDRFTSNEELLAYVQTPAGKRFLESAPIPLESGPAPMSAPVGRIFGSMQAGLVVTALGIGMWLASGHVPSGASEPMYAIAIVAICVGIALVLSAGAFYAISRRFGLWHPQPATSEPNAG